MELIRYIESRRDSKGRLRKWFIFKCSCCLQEVERGLANGLRNKSCGHCKGSKKLRSEARIKHGETGTRLYMVWALIKQRIFNPKASGYKDYGGRGITVCNEWLEFISFRDWALNNGYTEGLEINRMNNNNNYEPSNCNFVTHEENAQNKRNNKIKSIKIANEIRDLDKTGLYTRKEIAIKYNVSIVMISNIINNKSWKNI